MTQFNPLDRQAEIHVTERHLLHWYQPGAATFITFRTADSMPKEVIERWRLELESWLKKLKRPIGLAGSMTGVRADEHQLWLSELTAAQQGELKRLSNRLFHRSLDDCHGRCDLQRLDVAKTVADAIRYFDGDRYDLDRFIVMPNHVHAIVQFREGNQLDTVSQSWMRFTAREINPLIGSSGAFWQAEPFDHIIRSDAQFAYLQQYISDNPMKAKLSESQFLLWKRPE